MVGLNTALLAADDYDKGHLRLGKEQITKTLLDSKDSELTLVLTHHPFQDGWLSDQSEADGWIRGRAHIHLSGHVHETHTESLRPGSGGGVIRVVSGAAYSSAAYGVPTSHGYNVAAVVRTADGEYKLQVWPRKWSHRNKDFRVDAESTPPGRAMTEHDIPRLKFPR